MTFRKKLIKQQDISEKRELFINEAAHEKSDIQSLDKDEWLKILLRIPKYVLDRVDEKSKKQIGMTRTQWILQVIQKELEK